MEIFRFRARFRASSIVPIAVAVFTDLRSKFSRIPISSVDNFSNTLSRSAHRGSNSIASSARSSSGLPAARSILRVKHRGVNDCRRRSRVCSSDGRVFETTCPSTLLAMKIFREHVTIQSSKNWFATSGVSTVSITRLHAPFAVSREQISQPVQVKQFVDSHVHVHFSSLHRFLSIAQNTVSLNATHWRA